MEVAASHLAMCPPLSSAYPPPAPPLSDDTTALLLRTMRALAAHLINPSVVAAHRATGAPDGDSFEVHHPTRPRQRIYAPPPPPASVGMDPSDLELERLEVRPIISDDRLPAARRAYRAAYADAVAAYIAAAYHRVAPPPDDHVPLDTGATYHETAPPPDDDDDVPDLAASPSA